MKRSLTCLLWIGLSLASASGAVGQQDSTQVNGPVGCPGPPTLTGCGSATLDLGCNPKSPPACDPSIKASDCQGPVAVECIPGPMTEAGCRRTQSFTYSATGTGGTSTCSVTYTWTLDTQRPVITLAPASEVSPNPTADQIAAAFGAASVSDDCGTDLIATGTLDPEMAGGGCSYSVTQRWTVTDSCGNTGTASQTVRFRRDTRPPTITCPADVVVNGLGKPRVMVSLGIATASDSCGTVKVTNDAPKNPGGGLAPFPVGTTFVTWTATDGAGNTSTCQQQVTVRGQIKVTPFFDANGNGTQDLPAATAGEGVVPDLTITLSDGSSGTNGSGAASFDVAPGTYGVSVAVPNGWIRTTDTPTVTIDSTNCSVTAALGLVFLCKPPNGLTPDFWTGASGEQVLNANPGWVALLNGLMCLRNADGTLHAFTTVADLKTWLLDAGASNMAYMLSAHLAASVLSSSYNGLGGTVFVPGGVKTKGNVCIVPFVSVPQPSVGTCDSPLLTPATFATPGTCGCTSNDGQVTIGDLQLKAACLLAAYPNTVAASAERTYQECVRDILDMIDSNGDPSAAGAHPCGGVMVPVPAGTCPGPVTPVVTSPAPAGG